MPGPPETGSPEHDIRSYAQGSGGLITAGGYVGVLTALVAWYASAALVINGMTGKHVVPVGGPLLDLGA